MLIIFDCDGVLVDSERMAAEVFSDVLSSVGIHMLSHECFTRFKGKTLPACFSWIEERFGVDLPSNFSQLLNEKTDRYFSQELKAVDGVKETLNFLTENKVEFCVASNGGHKKIENSLTVTGLIEYFPHRFSVDDVNEGKPKPDVFLYAAKKMGFHSSDCLVIEDSLSGVKAAQSAGMGVVIYQADEQMIEPGVWHFSHMQQLCEKLRCESVN